MLLAALIFHVTGLLDFDKPMPDQTRVHLPLFYPTYRNGRSLEAPVRDAIFLAFTSEWDLRGWPESSLHRLCDAGRIRTWGDGQLICALGSSCGDVHVVLSGAIELSCIGKLGERAIEAYIGPNEVCNLVPALDGHSSMHDQTARGATTLFHIPGAAVIEEFSREPKLMRLLLDLMCARVRILHSRIARRSVSGLRSRLAGHLLELARSHGRTTADGIEITVRMSQEALASLLGTSRQSTNKELRRFARDRIVDTRYSHLTILDIDGLRAISLSDE
ncbi:Crp/Fnr family transcriptional regulator [Burkholderia anthina]|uniref:Crp/Fnr family transcriptional regulator n=1 Tax=Burkholderia anthina TaxID=179879 RepID=UPI00158907CD|nr:Crp/Fnr family transcriptional regulator [Burkholderia anthina]